MLNKTRIKAKSGRLTLDIFWRGPNGIALLFGAAWKSEGTTGAQKMQLEFFGGQLLLELLPTTLPCF